MAADAFTAAQEAVAAYKAALVRRREAVRALQNALDGANISHLEERLQVALEDEARAYARAFGKPGSR